MTNSSHIAALFIETPSDEGKQRMERLDKSMLIDHDIKRTEDGRIQARLDLEVAGLSADPGHDPELVSQALGIPKRYLGVEPSGRAVQMKKPRSASVSIGEKEFPDRHTFSVADVEVDANVAKTVYDRAMAEIAEAEQSNYTVETLVVGIPQYRALMYYAKSVDDSVTGYDPEDLFMGIDLIAVPGPMLHAVRSNKELLWKNLTEDDV